MAKRAVDKRKAIVEAALLLFTEKGFQGTPTSEIAKKAGVATGTLFNYFKTKEELINKLYLEIKEELGRELKADLKSDLLVKEKIRRIWYNGVNWALRHPAQHRFFQQFSSSPYITRLTKEEAIRHWEFIAEIFQQGQQEGVLKDMPLDLLLEICLEINIATANHFLAHHDRTNDPEYWEMAFEMCWDGVRKV